MLRWRTISRVRAWEEHPVDGWKFDRVAFNGLGAGGVYLTGFVFSVNIPEEGFVVYAVLVVN